MFHHLMRINVQELDGAWVATVRVGSTEVIRFHTQTDDWDRAIDVAERVVANSLRELLYSEVRKIDPQIGPPQ